MTTLAQTKLEQLEQMGYRKEKKEVIGTLHVGNRSFLTFTWPHGEDIMAFDVCTNYGSVDDPLYVLEIVDVVGDYFVRYGVFLPEREVWVPK